MDAGSSSPRTLSFFRRIDGRSTTGLGCSGVRSTSGGVERRTPVKKREARAPGALIGRLPARIAAFLDIAIDESIWPSLVRAAGFSEMRQAGAMLMPQTKTTFGNGDADRFFNKGTNGRWRDVLMADDLVLYDAKVREMFTPGLAAWVACGPRESGEPRDSVD